MNYPLLREELKDYYWHRADEAAQAFFEDCTEYMDKTAPAGMNVYEMKAFQYRTITERFSPVLFYHSPFYYETGTMPAHSDGARDFHGKKHAGGWTFRKNYHLFIDQDEALWEKKKAQAREKFYLICGAYNDTNQHFAFYYRPIFSEGLRGIYERAQKALVEAKEDEERAFLTTLMEGMLCLKRASEKFAEAAEAALPTAPDEIARKNLSRIAEAARRTPWEKPKSLWEALNCLAFLRKVMGALEGIGFNSFGRLDLDLLPFYEKDLATGALTKDEAYEIICQFLITFDLHYDHDMPMVGYADHELENTYVLGGVDPESGQCLYNELTRMFLTATREEKILFPKIKCRFSKASPKEYLDEINQAILRGTSAVLFQNDDAVIPALLRAGRTLKEARDYIVTGCWGLSCNGVEKYDNGNYVNLLKPFEYSLHRLDEKMAEVGMQFAPLDGAKDFEQVYQITMDNLLVLLRERAAVGRAGGNIWNRVDPLPLFSSTLENCLESKRDYTAGGAKYRDDCFKCIGLPNIVDSLLVIKTLCFDQKKYTLDQLLCAVRSNWEGYEIMQAEAKRCTGWGDGTAASCALATRFQNDLFQMTQSLTGTYGGKVHLGHLTYTEIRFWGEVTLATPDGRKAGEYFSQGLTPSRLKKIPSVTSVIRSLAALDPSTMAANNVVNIILPSNKIDLDRCEGFLRAAAESSLMCLQLNCTTREELLAAQEHPEKYPDLIIRVTGFSAKFTSLSRGWQDEILSRNFYE